MDIFEFYEYNLEAYDLRCRPFAPAGAPAGAVICEVAPGQASRIHNHAETEAFLVLEGEGIVTDGVIRKPIRAGQGVLFAPFVNHIIENGVGAAPLRLISIYWMGDLGARNRESWQAAPDLRDTLVFSAGASGDQTPHRSGEILSRALQQRGAACHHVRASDRAVDAQDRAAFRDMIIARLIRTGHVVSSEAPAFSDAAGRFVHESHICGTCPHCGCATSVPFCEICHLPVACASLIDPRDSRDDKPVQVAPFARLFFRLAAFAPRLETVIKQMQMPTRAYARAQAVLDHGLHDIPFSHPAAADTPMQLPGHAGHAADPLAERLIGYLWDMMRARTRQAGMQGVSIEALGNACHPDRMLVHCYGRADIVVHTLLLPALLSAIDDGLAMPRQHVLAPFPDPVRAPREVRSDGVTDRLAVDPHPAPAAEDAFSECLLEQWADNVAALLAPHGGTVPEPGAWLADQQAWLAQLHDLAGRLDRLLTPEAFDPQIASRSLQDFALDSIRFCEAQRQLATTGPARDYARTAAALAALGLKAFGILSVPLLPESAARIRGWFPDSVDDVRDAAAFLPAGAVFRRDPTAVARLRDMADA
jgi:methionyl-tRNA synthetase